MTGNNYAKFKYHPEHNLKIWKFNSWPIDKLHVHNSQTSDSRVPSLGLEGSDGLLFSDVYDTSTEMIKIQMLGEFYK